MPLREVDQLVAGAQRPALLRRRAVAAQAERGDIVVERDVEPIAGAPLPASPSRSTSLLRISQPDWPAIGATSTERSVAATGPRTAAAIERAQPAAGSTASATARASAPHHATIFTSRSGTTMTLRGLRRRAGAGPCRMRARAPRPRPGRGRAARSACRAACR